MQPSTKSELSLWRTVFCRFASQKQQVGNFQSCLINIHTHFIMPERFRISTAVMLAMSSPQQELALPLPSFTFCGECLFLSCPTTRHTPCAAPARDGWRLFCLLESGTGISLENYMYQHMHISQAKTKNYNEINHECTCSLRSADAFRTEKCLHN